ncbi:MAG: cyclic pyranopterin monophosphate synthase MoaC [Desulfovibrio sp.]|nr:MAG: cyclic pyranopterin monophosphate synthase MoaC [Desulfovibrio sp.]
MSKLTHLDETGKARMVDVGHKPDTERVATAQAVVCLNAETFGLLAADGLPKGDVLAVARVAGIQAAKKTSELIPLCHPLFLSSVDIDFSLDKDTSKVRILAKARTTGPTGVEMEALTAAQVAALTIYDMCKAVQKDIIITDCRLLTKSGGRSGDYRAPDQT